ncbi:MAG: hypothetical protein HY231_13395 [Acidobacteria bacterium]|nr:hypothetical protein [Acidobacteriota bacterium]
MKIVLLVALYRIAIVAANLRVAAFGTSVVIVKAFLFIGLDRTTRDRLHQFWRGKNLGVKIAALIAAGSPLSCWQRSQMARCGFSFSAFFNARRRPFKTTPTKYLWPSNWFCRR